MWNRGPIGGPFTLIDHTGKLRTDEDFRGKLLLISFGYSYCPDVCPTDLQQIGLAVDGLSAGADAVQPLFITLDPERDTAVHLADYVPLFHPRLIGLTGSAEQIRRVALAYKVYYAKYPPDSPDYVIDHSSFIYLVDKAGKIHRLLSARHHGRPYDRNHHSKSFQYAEEIASMDDDRQGSTPLLRFQFTFIAPMNFSNQ
jgi:cytochrome oxidase Cu insertion factor (SCO1/SenC/PrrC family)